MVDRQSAHLLGSHVADGSHGHAGQGQRGRQVGQRFFRLHQLGEAEVEDLNASIFGDEQIVGLQIAVDDAFFVRGGKAASDLHAIVNSFAEGQGTAADRLGQGLTFQQFGYEIGNAGVSSHLVDGENIGMIQRSGGPGFLLEAEQAIGVKRDESGKNFDRDVAV